MHTETPPKEPDISILYLKYSNRNYQHYQMIAATIIAEKLLTILPFTKHTAYSKLNLNLYTLAKLPFTLWYILT